MPKVHLPRSFSPIPRTFPPRGTLERAKCFQNLLIWTNINEIFIKLYNLFYVSFRPLLHAQPPFCSSSSSAFPTFPPFTLDSTSLTFSQSCQLLPQHSIEKVSPMRTMFRIEKKTKKWKRDRQRKSEMTRTRKIKNFAEKARSGGRKRKRVIKFHKNPLLAMLTYSVCRFLRLLLLYSSCAWAKCANSSRQSPEKNSDCPRPCCTCSFLWHSFRFDCEAIQLLILFTAFSFASSCCGMWQDCAVGDKSQKVATPPQTNENVAYISYFCPSLSLCLSLCDCHWQLNAPLDNNKHNNKN